MSTSPGASRGKGSALKFGLLAEGEADLYPRLGFTALPAGADSQRWSLDIAARAPTATAIAIDDRTQLQAAE